MAKRQPLNVRYNNPGNLRTATLDDAYNFWGQDMVKGRDDSGFIQFVSPRAGIDSLYQQLRVDAGRKHTLGSFLDKFTPVDDDPEGNAISKETVPNWLGASLDTPLSDIDPRDLAEAITKKEGGQAAVDFFGPQLAPFAEMDRAQGDTIQRANEAELARFSTPREEPPAPETAPNAALERVLGVDASFPSRDRARSNMPASVLNSINAPVFEEQGPPVPAEIGSTNAPAYEEQGPPIPTGMESILGSIDSARRGIPASVLNSIQSQESPFFQEPSPNFNDMRVKATEEKMAGGTYAPARTNEETEKQNPNFRFFEAGSGKPLSFSLGKPLFNPPGPVQGAASTTTQSSTVATNPESQAPASQDVPSQGQGRNILKFLGDNPEIINALGLLTQGVGDIYQNRAMAKANKQTAKQQRVNNAIAAFLGTRAEQATPRYKQSTGGGIAQALGQALSGYGQQRAATNAMRADIEGQRLDRESAERIAQIRAGAAGSGDADGGAGDIANALASFEAYTGALDRAVDEGLGGEPYADFVLDIPILRRMFPEAQAAQPMFEAAALNIATAIQGSRPSEGDRIAFAMLMPQLSDSAAARQAKIRNIRELLNAAQGGQKFQEGWAQKMLGNTSQGGTDPLGLSGATAGDPLGLGG